MIVFVFLKLYIVVPKICKFKFNSNCQMCPFTIYIYYNTIFQAKRNQDKYDWAVIFVQGRFDASGRTFLHVSGEL